MCNCEIMFVFVVVVFAFAIVTVTILFSNNSLIIATGISHPKKEFKKTNKKKIFDDIDFEENDENNVFF